MSSVELALQTLNLDKMSEAMKFSLLPRADQLRILDKLSEKQLKALPYDWHWWGRPEQLQTIHEFLDGPWTQCLYLAGRGSGKTRTGAEFVRYVMDNGIYTRGGIVAPTAGDARSILIEGDSGILSCYPPDKMPKYEPAKTKITWPNGGVVTIYSADEPKRFRGPNFQFVWLDELANWAKAQETWDMISFALRKGNIKALITTTPLPTQLIMELADDTKETYLIQGSTHDNLANLSQKFIDKTIKRYEGTTLYDQEILGQIVRNMGGLFKPSYMRWVEEKDLPRLTRVVVAIDPAGSRSKKSDFTGISVCAKGADDNYYLLSIEADQSSPKEWADRVAKLYKEYKADKIIAEKNYGGEMVETTINKDNKDLPVQLVNASRGKLIRAEPISLLYQKGKIFHVKPDKPDNNGYISEFDKQRLENLSNAEKQMYAFRNKDNEKNDMVDAIVWGFIELAENEIKELEAPAVVPYNSPMSRIKLL